MEPDEENSMEKNLIRKSKTLFDIAPSQQISIDAKKVNNTQEQSKISMFNARQKEKHSDDQISPISVISVDVDDMMSYMEGLSKFKKGDIIEWVPLIPGS